VKWFVYVRWRSGLWLCAWPGFCCGILEISPILLRSLLPGSRRRYAFPRFFPGNSARSSFLYWLFSWVIFHQFLQQHTLNCPVETCHRFQLSFDFEFSFFFHGPLTVAPDFCTNFARFFRGLSLFFRRPERSANFTPYPLKSRPLLPFV